MASGLILLSAITAAVAAVLSVRAAMMQSANLRALAALVPAKDA